MNQRIVVVGAGIGGLSIAYELLQRSQRAQDGMELVCLEAAPRPGGVLSTTRDHGFLCEAAASAFLDRAPATVTLGRRLGLESRLVHARLAARRRLIYFNGRLHELPTTPGALLRSRALSTWGKLRLLGEPFVPRRRPGSPDESVQDFASRRVGRRATCVLVDALASGVAAGDIRRLSLRATFPGIAEMERTHGSLLRGLLAHRRVERGTPAGRLTTFDEGLQVLTDALAAALGSRLRLGVIVERVTSLGRRGFRVQLREGAPIDAGAVVLACPARVSTALLAGMDPQIAGILAEIRTVPVVVAHLGFKRDALGPRPKGFGFLVPRGQGVRSLGVIWSSDVFSGRAPEGSLLLTAMLGGAHDTDAVSTPDAMLLAAVREDLRRTMGVHVQPYMTRIVRHAHGIPQYELGHLDRIARLEDLRSRHPGLWFAGWSLYGISVEAGVERAGRIAEEALEFLARRTP